MIAALALMPGERVAIAQAATPDESVQALIEQVNEVLEAQGSELRLLSADFLTRGKGKHHGRKAVWRKYGFDRADAEFVPNDPRRSSWSGPASGEVDDIRFAIDQSPDAVPVLGNLSADAATAAIRRATATWDRVRCSGLKLTEVTPTSDVGVIGFIANGGRIGSPALVADIVHAGFRNLSESTWKDVKMPGLFMEPDLVAVTFTFVFTSDGKTPTDVDGNKKWDVGFHEIYYSPSVTWSDERRHKRDDDDDDDRRRHKRTSQEEVESFDIETVALHEIGHALSLGHYGQVVKRKDGAYDAQPEAVMNPIYTGVQRRLQGADVAAHCMGGWKTWPKAKKNRGRDRD